MTIHEAPRATSPHGIRIKPVTKLSTKIMAATNRIATLIEAADPLAQRARTLDLIATAEQIERIRIQLDVMRTVLLVEGDAQLDVARAYADVCEDRLVVHAAYVGQCARGR